MRCCSEHVVPVAPLLHRHALVVVGSLGLIAPVGVYFAMGDKATKALDGWKAWLAANNATVMIVLFVVFGVTLVGKGIGGLS